MRMIIFTLQVWRGDDARFQSILQLLPWWRPMLVALCRWPRKCLHPKTKIRFLHISPPLQIWRERMRRGSWLARTSSILDLPSGRLIRDWLRWHWLGALLAKVFICNFNSVCNLAHVSRFVDCFLVTFELSAEISSESASASSSSGLMMILTMMVIIMIMSMTIRTMTMMMIMFQVEIAVEEEITIMGSTQQSPRW